MQRTIRALAAAALVALALAGCGTASHTLASSAASAGPAPTASATPAANVRACQDYAKQRAWIRANEATLTLVDIGTIGGWLQMDADNSTGQLHTDMAAFAAAYQHVLATGNEPSDTTVLRQRVSADCTAVAQAG